MSIHLYVNKQCHAYICMCLCLYIKKHMNAYQCTHLSIYIYSCIYKYVYKYIYTHHNDRIYRPVIDQALDMVTHNNNNDNNVKNFENKSDNMNLVRDQSNFYGSFFF
jgi:HD superfamily phosphohydrolase